MSKKLSIAAVFVIALTYLSVSIVYACSGLSSMDAVVGSSMDGMTKGKDPCNEHKQDICKSVRHSLLSVKPPVSEAVTPQLTAASVQLSIDSPTLLIFSPVAPVIESAYHPVFKLPLTLSYLVLRI